MEYLELAVSGMHWYSCARRVEAAVAALAGVETAEARTGSERVGFYPEAVTRAQIVATVEHAGHPVSGEVGADDALGDSRLVLHHEDGPVPSARGQGTV